MFLTLTTQGRPGRPASDLGFLLHKHPEKAQAFTTSHGTAHVFYPEASNERCTAAMLLEVDAVALVRAGKGKGRGGAPDSSLGQYVNDRPYAASSLLAVALGAVFRSAGRAPGNLALTFTVYASTPGRSPGSSAVAVPGNGSPVTTRCPGTGEAPAVRKAPRSAARQSAGSSRVSRSFLVSRRVTRPWSGRRGDGETGSTGVLAPPFAE